MYNLKKEDVFKELKSSAKGLTNNDAKKRLEQYGYNELSKNNKHLILKLFLSQFNNALIMLLIFAGILSLFLGDLLDSIVIFSIVLLNSILGFVQEYKAEKSIELLQRRAKPSAKVLRNGKIKTILSREVVPGDIIFIEAGDMIPADCRLLEITDLKIDESSLTGESFSAEKNIALLKKNTSLADQKNMIFSGTAVVSGKGKAIVINTGMKTEFGKIAQSLQTTKEVKTPLQVKFEKLAKQIGIIAISLIIIILLLGSLQAKLTFAKMVLFALVLAVATIPSALPVIVTIGLAKGANDLAKKNMLIKKLPAAESLGSTTIICSDKTGTITKNQMTVTKIYFNNKIIDVTGVGYQTTGKFYQDNKEINPNILELPLMIGRICNNAQLVNSNIIGDPTEGALIVLSKKAQLKEKKYSILKELSFDSERKRMSVIVNNQVYTKGAPDLLLNVCNRIYDQGKVRKITLSDKKKIIQQNNLFAKDALRVLGLAYSDKVNKNIEEDLIFVGLVGMIDPPRDEIKKAVEQCHDAGIKVMIITGDHAETTKAIAHKVGLLRKGDLILTGTELDKMSDSQLKRNIDKIKIIARALPIQKLRIVEMLQRKGHVVAMTGDGINDSPALKKADIGIAMGTGTDVAKEVSKAILVDDNFATIVKAIEEGRNIYDKMIKSAKYLLSCNSGEIMTVLIAILIGLPLPLIPLQILLINLLTDTSPALGLGFEGSEEGIMKRKPHHPKDNPITKRLLYTIIIFGFIMGFGTLFMFSQYENLIKAQTIAFTTLVMFQMFAVLSSRSLYPSIKKLNPFSNLYLLGAIILSVLIQIAVIYLGPLQTIFGTVALSSNDWLKIILVSSIGFIIMELSKLFMK
jgi:P-type Ca2+ transporter type 2C